MEFFRDFPASGRPHFPTPALDKILKEAMMPEERGKCVHALILSTWEAPRDKTDSPAVSCPGL